MVYGSLDDLTLIEVRLCPLEIANVKHRIGGAERSIRTAWKLFRVGGKDTEVQAEAVAVALAAAAAETVRSALSPPNMSELRIDCSEREPWKL